MNRAAFFDHLRTTGVLGPVLTADEVSQTERLLDAMRQWPLAWIAYGLATAYHETAHTMRPVREHGGPQYWFRMYDPESPLPRRAALAKREGALPGDGVRFYGRGHVQLTWRKNYRRAGLALGVPLEADPDRALEGATSARIMVWGMEGGHFTGRKNADYLPRRGPASVDQFRAARRIINGVDKAALIASYAVEFQIALVEAGL